MTSSIVSPDDNLLGPDSSMAMDREAAGDYEMDSDGRAIVSGDSSENLPAKETRVMKKAHRASKNEGATEAVAANGVQHSAGGHDGAGAGATKHGVSAVHKSHRRHRHARGRVQLKKGNCLALSKISPHCTRVVKRRSKIRSSIYKFQFGCSFSLFDLS